MGNQPGGNVYKCHLCDDFCDDHEHVWTALLHLSGRRVKEFRCKLLLNVAAVRYYGNNPEEAFSYTCTSSVHRKRNS
eukprot:g16603.t1